MQINVQMEERHRARYIGRGTELMLSLLSPNLHVLNPILLGLYTGFLTRYE